MGQQDGSDDCYLRVASQYTALGYLIALTEPSPSKETVLTLFQKKNCNEEFYEKTPTLHWRLASSFSWSKDSHLKLGGSFWWLSFFSSSSSMSLRKRCSGYLNYVTPGCDLWSTGTRCQHTANFACWSSVIPLLLSTPFLTCLQHSQSQHRRSCAGWDLCLNLTPFTSHPSKPSTPSKISSKNVLPSPHSLLSSLPAQLLYQDDSWWNPSLHVTSYATPWKIALTPVTFIFHSYRAESHNASLKNGLDLKNYMKYLRNLKLRDGVISWCLYLFSAMWWEHGSHVNMLVECGKAKQ